jgi:hypothetical protein
MLVAVYSGMGFIFSPIAEGLSDRAQTVISSPALASLVSSFKGAMIGPLVENFTEKRRERDPILPVVSISLPLY